jgi:hypothetical protein
MHEEIKKFSIQGIVGDEADVVQNKENLILFVEGDMRDEGYVPVLDMDPQYTQQYQPVNNWFEFALSVYGVHVGEDKAWDVAGMMNGKMIMKSTPLTKSKES